MTATNTANMCMEVGVRPVGGSRNQMEKSTTSGGISRTTLYWFQTWAARLAAK